MKKSLFSRILLTTILLLSITVFVALAVGKFLVQRYYINIKIEELKPEITGIVKEIEAKGKSSAPLNELDFIIKAYDTDKREMPIFEHPFIKPSFEIDGEAPYLGNAIEISIEPFIDKVINGNEIAEIHSLKAVKGVSIVIGCPIRKNGDIIGSVFLLKPVNDYNSALKGFYMTFLIISIALIFIIYILLYFLLRRIIRPLEKMIEASNAIAQGEYQIRIKDKGYGEVEQLAESLNTLSESLEASSKKTLELEQARKDYFSNISHELRTPVASIRARSEALKDGMIKNESDKHHYYSEILSESIRLQNLIQDMLELSRLKSGNEAIIKKTVKAYELLNSTYKKFVPMAHNLNLNWFIDCKSDIIDVWTNYDRIEQVLIILIDNAFKFTSAGGTIKLSAMEASEKIIISISDSGIGISKEELPFVFERFYKADKSHSKAGTGLGLAIAKQIISVLEEAIWIESEPGAGSIFYFTLSKKY